VATTAKEFRAYAAECMEAAKTANTDEEREAFLQMAMDWLRAASLAEPMLSARPNIPSSSVRWAPLSWTDSRPPQLAASFIVWTRRPISSSG
jgi:hypothetical protein